MSDKWAENYVTPDAIVPDYQQGYIRRYAEGVVAQAVGMAFDAYDTVKTGITTLSGLDIVPVAFDGATFSFTRPADPTLPSFPTAPDFADLTPPTLADAVDLSFIAGLESGIEAFVAGNTEDASYARIVAALDAAGADEMQQTAERWGAAGWTEPAGPQSLALLATSERVAADKRAKLRDAFVDVRDKALRIGLDAVRGQNEAVAAANRAKVDVFGSQAEALRTSYTAYGTAVSASASVYDATVRWWNASTGIDLEAAKFEANYGLESIKAQIEQNERLTGLAFEAARAATGVGAQVTAGAMSAWNVSLSAGESQSIDVRIGNSAGISVDANQNE